MCGCNGLGIVAIVTLLMMLMLLVMTAMITEGEIARFASMVAPLLQALLSQNPKP